MPPTIPVGLYAEGTIPIAGLPNPSERLHGPPGNIPARDALAIGIDIESADNLPSLGDPLSEPFYVENFTRAEIAWCLRQPDPQLSFCGLWSAKEAALKCGPQFAGLRPIRIEILHDEHSRPMLQTKHASHQALGGDCVLSISLSGRTVVAVCVNRPQPPRSSAPTAGRPDPAMRVFEGLA